MKKIPVEDCEQISITRLKWRIISDYPVRTYRELEILLNKLSEKSLKTHFAGLPYLRLRFTTTKCNFGGVRYWFLCPACNRRIGKLYAPLYVPLYAPSGAGDFKCRHCHNLTYTTAQTHNGRLHKLYQHLQHIGRTQRYEVVEQMVKSMSKSFQGCKDIMNMYEKWRDIENPRPNYIGSPYWIREKKTEEGFDRSVKPLIELLKIKEL
jgi:hypothetical protein